MATAETDQSTLKNDALLALQEIQGENMILTLLGLYVVSLLLFGSGPGMSDIRHAFLPGVLLLFLSIGVLLARRASYKIAAWLLVAGCIVVDWLLATWGSVSIAIMFLALPVGLAVMLLSLRAGVVAALAATLALALLPAPFGPADPTLRGAAAAAMWGTIWLMGLTLRPLSASVQWSWTSYEEARRLLDEARDSRLRLNQTLADLADANLQLTRLNKLAQTLRLAAEEARQGKQQFVANVSHELRTPLNMIVGFSEMIIRAPEIYGSALPAALQADLSVIRRNSQHLASLIDDVLDLSQIEAGQMALTRERVDTNEIIADAVAAVRPLFKSKNLSLTVDAPVGLPSVFCDRTRIREVMLNLLSNAGRFTEKGGVQVRVWRNATDVLASVADTGPGIAERDKDRIFQPFQQLDGSVRRRYGGTGLGLSISRSFIELHGGAMWLESTPGVGTTFFFRLPIDPPTPTDTDVARWFTPYASYEERTRGSLAPAPVVRPRLVVAEEHGAAQRILTRYLDQVEIVPVHTLDEAIENVTRVPAQALVVNASSVGSALHLLDASGGPPANTPVIICSIPDQRQTTDALGVSGYLVKPVALDALLSALDGLHLKGKTVLVVDDEPEVVRLFRRSLMTGGRGYHVLGSSNARQALRTLRSERPDVVLLDLVMPEMNGFQFLAAKNADPALRDIPVILVSATDPIGQPIVTNALAVTCSGGISVHQLLGLIEAIMKVLSPADLSTGPTRPAAFPDSPASAERQRRPEPEPTAPGA